MSDIVIAGNTYSDVPKIIVPKAGGGNAEYSEGGGTINLQATVLRPDATLIKVWSADDLVVEDLEWTIPSYSTSSKTLHTGAALSTTYSLDYSYNWFIVEKFLLTPVYSTSALAKGKPTYNASAYFYEISEFPGDTFSYGGKTVTTRSVTTNARGSVIRQPYYSSTSALSVYTAGSYGFGASAVAPSISSGTLTVSDPTITMRGSTTYLTSAVWGTVTDIRRQYRIELWRSPKDSYGVDGWEGYQTVMHIVNDAQGTGTLT